MAGRQLLIQRQLSQAPLAFRRMSALTEIMRASVKPRASCSTVVGVSTSHRTIRKNVQPKSLEGKLIAIACAKR